MWRLFSGTNKATPTAEEQPKEPKLPPAPQGRIFAGTVDGREEKDRARRDAELERFEFTPIDSDDEEEEEEEENDKDGSDTATKGTAVQSSGATVDVQQITAVEESDGGMSSGAMSVSSSSSSSSSAGTFSRFFGSMYDSVMWIVRRSATPATKADKTAEKAAGTVRTPSPPAQVLTSSDLPPLPVTHEEREPEASLQQYGTPSYDDRAATALPAQQPQQTAAGNGRNETQTMEMMTKLLEEVAMLKSMIADGLVPPQPRPFAAPAVSPMSPPPPPLPPSVSPFSASRESERRQDETEQGEFLRHFREEVLRILRSSEETSAAADATAKEFAGKLAKVVRKAMVLLSYPAVVVRFASDPETALRRVTTAESVVFGKAPKDKLPELKSKYRSRVEDIAAKAPECSGNHADTLVGRCEALAAAISKAEQYIVARQGMLVELAAAINKRRQSDDDCNDGTK